MCIPFWRLDLFSFEVAGDRIYSVGLIKKDVLYLLGLKQSRKGFCTLEFATVSAGGTVKKLITGIKE
jgi:hypothetical protein